MSALAPVIEIACDHQRRVARDRVGHECEQPIDLPPTLRLPQAQVHAHCVQRWPRLLHFQHAMKQAARLDTFHRHIDVLPANDRKLRQQRVAQMTPGRDGIAAIGVLRPHLVGQQFVVLLRDVLPVVAADFLQEDQVDTGCAERFADAGKQLATTERAEALLGVQRQQSYRSGFQTVFTNHARGGYPLSVRAT